ncbi:MAG TPA: thioredoxin fold domain-containing protein [Thermotogota bacterium]|nr:thioredoxin fold domain-containing protein [Thermotogota bacterium]HPJ87691.1 thioredoxin fold domain-containing protein [Thermotogota bacterium]HPR94870.1 thioredoxin fold domain-containing protein [Thermotogota bacterium]
MKSKMIFVLVLLLFSITLLAIPVEDFLIFNDFNKGFELAKAMNKNVMILFSSSSCIYCKELKEKVLPSDDISSFIINNYILIELRADPDKTGNFDVENAVFDKDGKEFTYEELFYLFGIRGVPATSFFNTDLQYLGTLPGYHEKEDYLKWLKFIQQKAYEKGDISTFDDTDCCLDNGVTIREINAVILSEMQKTFPSLLSYWSFQKFTELNFINIDTNKIYIVRDSDEEKVSSFINTLDEKNIQNIYVVN